MIVFKTINLFCLLIFLLLTTRNYGQSYFANGTARSLGGDCYLLTGALDWQLGSVWYADPIDLSKDFDLEFYLNFGNKDGSGADVNGSNWVFGLDASIDAPDWAEAGASYITS